MPHTVHLHQELRLDASCSLALALTARAAQRINLHVAKRKCRLLGERRSWTKHFFASTAVASHSSGRPPLLQPAASTTAPLQHYSLPTSSMKTMEGAFSRASANRLLTSFSDSPSHLQAR